MLQRPTPLLESTSTVWTAAARHIGDSSSETIGRCSGHAQRRESRARGVYLASPALAANEEATDRIAFGEATQRAMGPVSGGDRKT